MSDACICPFVVSKLVEIGKRLRMKTQTACESLSLGVELDVLMTNQRNTRVAVFD